MEHEMWSTLKNGKTAQYTSKFDTNIRKETKTYTKTILKLSEQKIIFVMKILDTFFSS